MYASHQPEEWRDVPSLPGYEASSKGLLRSKETRFPVHQYFQSLKHPYMLAKLNHARLIIHRVVMEAFHGPSALQVNHKNGVKWDNRIENLEYVTNAQNVQHAYTLGLSENTRRASSIAMTRAHKEGRVRYSRGEAHYLAKLDANKVRAIKACLLAGVTCSALGKQYGVSRATIRQIKQGKSWRCV
jgi:hypothetical protein